MGELTEVATTVKVTLVIPTYNRADVITRTIQSVMKQTLKEWKAIIIDDGSTDHTEKVVKPLLEQDDRLSYYRIPENVGVCKALNKALELVTTEYMCQLDSDDWIAEHALKTLLTTMENQPKTSALAYGNYTTVWSNGNIRITKVRGFLSSEKYQLLSYAPMVYPRFYRTACLLDVGGWETNDKYGGRYMEDRRILFKLIEKYNFVWVDDVLYTLTRLSDNRLSALSNKDKYVELKKDLIVRTLENWGGEYTAEFFNNDEKIKGQGWVPLRLVPTSKILGVQDTFKSITVSLVGNELIVYNPTSYPLVGKGVEGAVFKLSNDRCVKIFANPKHMEQEKEAMLKGQGLSFMPKLYETGSNYIIREYIHGPSLPDYLKKQGTITKSMAAQIVRMIKDMKQMGYRLDRNVKLHILVHQNKTLKVIDHVNAYEKKSNESAPVRLFETLSKLGLLDRFVKQVKEIDPELYKEWKKYLGKKK